jgi:predicted esterase YcpF (UPF0227 family)
LPHSPAEAARSLDALVRRLPVSALVGSSLGGYYATWLSEKYRLKAALLNPAVRPYELLHGHLGPQQNLHTGERYELTARHVEELRSLEVESISPQRYLLIAATADEVLDYRAAVARYQGCRQMVIEGGDHSLGDFASHVDTVLGFCGVPLA